ncbi:cation transporter [Pseudolysobacter antarcticus]|uniref:Cation transporter n=1 Tax=Pseudolysobacter antarcticus TaxID=2511995 RepID=A0A411HKY5_9GAMM|nr:cation diffusion facilitator family transporter [Pseudolysobacter antarcticus]QBB71074.1 cation transporter [Pseudolysobacter antarcticus]
MSAKADSVKTVFYALGANFLIFVSKLVAAFITGSGSMLAEAVHSLADCGNQIMLLFGMRVAKRPASPDFPLGYGKAVYFWSFLVALFLFSFGGIFSVYEGIHKFTAPEPMRWPLLAIGVLGFSIVAEGFSMWGCMHEVNKARGEMSLWRWFRESRQSELIVIFGEDLAALTCLIVALIAVLLTWVTGNPIYDACGSMLIGALLFIVAIFVGYEVQALLIGQSAEPKLKMAIEEFVSAQPEVQKVFNVITLQLGPDVMVAVKAEMRGGTDGRGLVLDINRVEAAMKTQFPEIRWSFFEPDVSD